MITPNNIIRHELIGLNVEIIDSTNPNLISIKGRVVDETKNTLLIEKFKDGKEVRVPKDICTFRFELKDVYVDVMGIYIVGRPEDRLKKKIKVIYPY